jgi:endonuclease/exonuclease/phosphatase family metal-dependent hydrolase
LNREDYTDSQWNVLEKIADENNWNQPSFGDLLQLTSDGFIDSGTINSPTMFTAPTSEPKYRIDYLWTKNSPSIEINCLSHQVDTNISFSDHFPICVDLEFTCKNARL